MNYVFRKATRNDAKEVLSLYRSLVGSEYCVWTNDYPNEIEVDFDLSRDALFVMVDKDQIIASISIDLDEEVEQLSCWTKSLAPGAELSRVAVSLDYQNQGLARYMMEKMFDELVKRGYKSAHLLVAKDNLKAVNSYSKLNYNTVGQTEMFGHQYLCYEKKLE